MPEPGVLEILAYLSQILGGVGIFVAAVALLVQRNQLNFEVIASCTERFQRILIDLESEVETTRTVAERRYVDLCNEELFYFRNGYLPREVMREWLDGMLDRLPLWKDAGANEVYPGHRGRIKEERFAGYSKVREAFAVEERFCPTSASEREALVDRLMENVEPGYGVWRLAGRLWSRLPAVRR